MCVEKRFQKKISKVEKRCLEKRYVLATDRVSDVDMTENRDIPDHPWPYMREMFKIVGVKMFVFLY